MFLLPFPAGEAYHYCKAHRLPSGVCAAGSMATVMGGVTGGCFHCHVAKAGISGSAVFETWNTQPATKLTSCAFPQLSQ